MMTRFVTSLIVGLADIAALVACGGSGDGGATSSDAGTASLSVCPPENPKCREAATVDEGAKSVQSRKCMDCHTKTMAGSPTPIPVKDAPPEVKLYAPNLTNDAETGIGKWTDEQLAAAIRTGIDDEGLELCPQMRHFAEMSDYEVFSIVQYLRSIPRVKANIPHSVCPPFKE